MPRLLDKLDAATGGTPEVVDDVDYLVLNPSPAQLIGPDGRYTAGWISSFDGDPNFEATSALKLAFQQWIHLSFDTPDHFLVCNIADLTRASNVALQVVEKRTGRFAQGSVTRIGPLNQMAITDGYRRFSDPQSGSFVALSEDLRCFAFSLHVDGLHLSGQARTVLGPPLVQVTRFQRYRGSLQWYGALEVQFATLTTDGEVFSIPPGTMGTYDRTLGHQRGLQNWNWVAAAGWARDEQDGSRVPFAIQVAQDREQARPWVNARKYAVWIGGRLYKIPEAVFSYRYTDPATRETTDWTIQSPASDPRWLSLHFVPRYHRREQKVRWLIRADFNQYYGVLSGRFGLHGRSWVLEETFAVTEDSLLEL